MTALDTSVVVAGFASWHEAHRRAVKALGTDPLLPAHAMIEAFSVLTRLPAPGRAPAGIVAEFVQYHFGSKLVLLPKSKQLDLINHSSSLGIIGGAVYDALVAATASHVGATLLTLDRRATRTYDLLGVSYDLV